VRFALLGPVDVHGGGGPVEIRGALRRGLLATLLLNHGSVVSTDRLGELVWGDNPPTSVTTSLYNQIMRLRQALGEDADRIRAVAPGYLIHVEPGELDLDEFARLCSLAREATAHQRWTSASELYAEALALWRGDILADVPMLQSNAAIHQFQEDRLVAVRGRIEADLNLGRHEEVVGELHALISDHPLRETFHEQLMLALYRSGRQADALGVYRDLRRFTVAELGAEPGLALRELHNRILRSDPGLDAPKPAPIPRPMPKSASPGRSVPRQLPADTRLFTGRYNELAALDALAKAAGDGAEPGMAVISAINGLGGLGKTALAVRAGHRVAAQFPDGQLFIDLRGYSDDQEPVDAGYALDYLLRSLAVSPQAIPKDLGERAAFYRSRLAGTRTLILLDNVASTAQVRPLLPGAPGCLVVITSRNRLMGLDDAHLLTLDALSTDEAVSLLRRTAGLSRVPEAEDQHEVELLVELCGRLPLAVRIVAARLRHHRSLTVARLVAELRMTAGRLAHLRDEDRDLASVFESSYVDLPPAEQRLLRRLSLTPGPDFDVRGVANLIDQDYRGAERLLESLLDHNLLIQHTPLRYRLHDLVRAFALGLGRTDADEQGESAALDRLLTYFEHGAHAANSNLIRTRRPGPPPSAAAPAVAAELTDRDSSLAWMQAERANLLALIPYAAERGRVARAVYLAANLTTHLHQDGLWPQAEQMHVAVIDLASAADDAPAEAEALANLAWVRSKTGRTAAAIQDYEHALAVSRKFDRRDIEALALGGLAEAHSQRGDAPASIATYKQALDIYLELGDRRGEADTLRRLASEIHLSGDLQLAMKLLNRAQAAFARVGDRVGEATAIGSLGRIQFSMGDMAGAALSTESCLVIFRELGSKVNEATGLYELSRIRHATGAYEAAAELCRQSVALFRDLGHAMGQGNALKGLGVAALAIGDVPAAIGYLEGSLEVFRTMDAFASQADLLQELAAAHLAAGNHAAAASALTEAMGLTGEFSRDHVVAQTLHRLGTLTMATGAHEQALSYFRQARALSSELRYPLDEAQALEGAARCEVELGDRASALRDLREAVEIFQRVGAAEAEEAAAYLASLSD